MRPTRRSFFFTTTAAVTAQRTDSAAARPPVISRITLLEVAGDFVRPVAMNAYDERVKGKDATIRLIRAFLDDGTVGLGVEGNVPIREAGLAFLKNMIGVAPESVYRWESEQIAGFAPRFAPQMENPANAWFEGPLLDLVGKIRRKPAYALFGPSVRGGIDAYDGSLYFVDVSSGRGAEAVGEVAKAICADGFRALKLKVGRPLRWMPGEHGVVRDIEAVIAVREAVGANFNVMADANKVSVRQTPLEGHARSR